VNPETWRRAVRILHLFSNFKWTGPAEPAVALAAGLKRAGLDVVLRSSAYTKDSPHNFVRDEARARGLEPILDLALPKHRSFWRNAFDTRKLRAIFAAEKIDLVHTHLPNDFRLAQRARRGAERPKLVRSLYDTDPEAIGVHLAKRLAREAQAVIVFARAIEERLRSFGFPAERLVRLEPAIDLERFTAVGPSSRAKLGLDEKDFVVGIVARVQAHRRFDLLLDAAAELARRIPRFKLLVIGRGTEIDELAKKPAEQRGLLDKHVFFPGYVTGEAYPALLRALDAKIYLVPGSDGTARAVREALACGVPVVATRRGMLAELVEPGRTGELIDESSAALVAVLEQWHADPALRRRLAANAAAAARERFSLARQVDAVRALYARL
jgi:glycosyltransferase involved in cell wall biosynthesis